MDETDRLARQQREDLDLVEMLNTLCRGKITIILGSALIAVVAVIVCSRMPNIYRSEALLAPAPQNEGDMSSLMSQYGGLASIAGINLGSLGKSAVNKTTVTLEVLQSRAFIVHFAKEHDLVVPLMAAEGWDTETQRWIIDPDLYDENQKKWVRPVSLPYGAVPSDLEIYDKFVQDVLTVYQDSSTSLVTLAVESMSPVASRNWLDWLISDVNNVMRERDISQASRSINYLERELQETVVTEMRQIFYQLIEQETKKKMLAKVQLEYVLEIIDPPVVADRKISPKRSIIVIVACFLGGLLIVAYLLLKESLFPYKKNRANIK